MERRNNGNPLMYKAALLYSELIKAERYMKSLKEALDDCCNTKKDLREKIGIPFVAKMPKFRIFEREADEIKQKLRRVCSGEISLEIAREKADEYEQYIDEVLKSMDIEKIFPYINEE